MTDIDLATGLPELPEGHYWQIGRHSVAIRKHLPDSAWQRKEDHWWGYDFAALYGHQEFEKETKTVNEQLEVRKELTNFWPWTKKRYETVKEVRDVTYERQVRRTTEVVSVPTEYSGEIETIPAADRYVGSRYTSYGYYAGPNYERQPDRVVKKRKILTRDMVLELCDKAVKELDGLSLQGDYPPKKFDRD